VVVANKFVHAIKVDQDLQVVFTQLEKERIEDCRQQQIYSFEEHCEIRVSVLASDLGFVIVDFEGRLFVQVIVQKVFQDFLANHITDLHFALVAEFVPELKIVVELCPGLRNCTWQQRKQVVQKSYYF
jgi:hypothetical protein